MILAAPPPPERPVVGVLCCNEVARRPVQAVASRYLAPLRTLTGATVLLVPADGEAVPHVARLLDGLLLTGSQTHVAPGRYGADAAVDPDLVDHRRDDTALRLGEAMIRAGKPVFGICRGMQEINVLFGGTLSHAVCAGAHHPGEDVAYDALFAPRHDVALNDAGRLARHAGMTQLRVNSVHHQGVDRLGSGLGVEAVDLDGGLVEGVSARVGTAEVLGVQWHPECSVGDCAGSRAFFHLLGSAMRQDAAPRPPA